MSEHRAAHGVSLYLRQGVPAADIYLERATARTGNSTFFHVFRGAELLGRHREEAKARAQYRQALADCGFEVRAACVVAPAEAARLISLEAQDGLARRVELHFAAAHLHRKPRER